jgi:hypothetical protein
MVCSMDWGDALIVYTSLEHSFSSPTLTPWHNAICETQFSYVFVTLCQGIIVPQLSGEPPWWLRYQPINCTESAQ